MSRLAPATASPDPAAAAPGLLERLGALCSRQQLPGLATRLRELELWLADDMESCAGELARLPRGSTAVRRSAHHLLDLGGKRLRPACVALAARLGSGFGDAARELAVAVELIHNASLLHDDVIDLGARRRGAPAARVVYGNAASVVAGNWLLVTALERVARTGLPGAVERTLRTIGRMIAAEAIQLDNRGRLNLSRMDYFRVIRGKTAALFRWALFHGGLAGGLPERHCRALERYGSRLGVAFQLVDDLLDYAGDSRLTGKPLFADLREGKITYPLLLALERRPALRPLARDLVAAPAGTPLPAEWARRVRQAIVASGGVRDCRALARSRVRSAVACLADLPSGPGRDALVVLAEAAVRRGG